MRCNLQKIFHIILCLWIFTLVYPYPANASSNYSFRLSPSVIKVTTKPNKIIPLTINISNVGVPTFAKLELVQLTVSDNMGNFTWKTIENNTNEVNIIVENYAVEEPFLIESNQSLDVNLTVESSVDATTSEYMFGLIIKSIPQQSNDQEIAFKITSGILSQIIVSVSESSNISRDVGTSIFQAIPSHEFSIFGKKIQFHDMQSPVRISAFLENKNALGVEASGIININGKREATIGSTYIYPQNQRLVRSIDFNDNNCSDCSNNTSHHFKPQFPGLYRIDGEFLFGESGPTIYVSDEIFVFPILSVLIICTFLIAILTVLLYIYRHNTIDKA